MDSFFIILFYCSSHGLSRNPSVTLETKQGGGEAKWQGRGWNEGAARPIKPAAREMRPLGPTTSPKRVAA